MSPPPSTGPLPVDGDFHFHVLLYRPCIPQNTGNIGRLCVGTRCSLHLVRPLGFEITEKKVRRAGLDYWPHLSLEILDDWQPQDCPGTVHLFTRQADRSAFDVPFRRGDWLVFGPETDGLPRDWLHDHRERCVALPQYGPVRSQNLSNAVSAAVYLGLRDLHLREDRGGAGDGASMPLTGSGHS